MLHKYLYQLRQAKGYSQEQVSKALDLTRSTYTLVEQGKRDLTTTELRAAANLYGLTPADVINERSPEIEIDITPSQSEPKSDSHPLRISIPQDKLDKFRQVLLYILHRVGGKPNVGMTVLYKLLYFIDFDYYEKYEEQLMGLTYHKNHYGPTPRLFAKVIEKMINDGQVESIKSKFYEREQTKYLINPSLSLDLSLLSAQELSHIDAELTRLSDKTACELSDLSHQDVPWISAEEGSLIDYESVFYRTSATSVRVYDQPCD